MSGRASQVLFEILGYDASFTRVSQTVVEVIVDDHGAIRSSQMPVEVLVDDHGSARVSQVPVEVLADDHGAMYASQIIVEVLVLTHEVHMPLVYPTLKGLTFSVIKRPLFSNSSGTSQSQRDVRINYADVNLWEWELDYDYLPDNAPQLPGTTANRSDLRTLMGFFLAARGIFQGFLFLDPDDHSVVGQNISETDGVTNVWTLQRNFGWGDLDPIIYLQTPFEPIGYVNTDFPFHVYLDSVLVAPADYDIVNTLPYQQQIRFHTPPATGKIISVDMSYYYWVHFKDDMHDFEKFMYKLWSTKKIVLQSLKGP